MADPEVRIVDRVAPVALGVAVDFPVPLGSAGLPGTPLQVNSGAQPTISTTKPEATGSVQGLSYVYWGGNNARPQDIIGEMALNGVGRAGLTVRRKVHFGNGPYYYTSATDGIKDVPKQVTSTDAAYKAVFDFHDRTNLDTYLTLAIGDYEWWGRCVTENILSIDGRKITRISALRLANCRFSLINPDTGRSEYVVYNSNWKIGNTTYAQIVPIADYWWTPDLVRAWALKNNFRKFVRITPIYDPNGAYYPEPDWVSQFDNGWMKSTNQVAASKESIQKNQFGSRHHVRIPFSWWPNRFKEWADWKQEERDKAMQTVLDEISNVFTGAENAGKVIYSGFGQDENGNPNPGWEIEPIKDNSADGAFLPDANKGNSEMLASMGVDWTLLGQGGGASGGNGGGSGSDKREAYTILSATMGTDREHTLDAWYFAKAYNGWDPALQIGYREVALTTLDKNPNGRQNVAQL